MPPRIQASSLAHNQCQLLPLVPRAYLSTTLPSSALRNLRDPGSHFLSLDEAAKPKRTGTSGGSPIDVVRNIYKDGDRHRRTAARRRNEVAETLRSRSISEQFLRQMPRYWKTGDVYAPHDLSPYEMKKWKTPVPAKKDVIDLLGINPLDYYKNFAVISEYMTAFGRIKHSDLTGLRPVNQRKMARTIRRAIGLGLHPSVHKHPMLLLREAHNQPRQSQPSKPGTF